MAIPSSLTDLVAINYSGLEHRALVHEFSVQFASYNYLCTKNTPFTITGRFTPNRNHNNKIDTRVIQHELKLIKDVIDLILRASRNPA